jgi:hypothetical protein
MPKAQTPSHGAAVELARSVFADRHHLVYRYQYRAQIIVTQLVGGTPSHPDVAEAWLRAKLGDRTTDEQIQEELAAVLRARGVDMITASEKDKADAVDEVSRLRNLSGFKRDFDTDLARMLQGQASAAGMPAAEARATIGELYVEGRQLKAMIKEVANIAAGAGTLDSRGWGHTRKSLLSFVAEHIHVPDDRIYLAQAESTRVNQAFVHTWRGSGIKNEEVVADAVLDFAVWSDWPWTDDEWAVIWVTAERNGLGASRSQGFGTFAVTRWERRPPPAGVAAAKIASSKVAAAPRKVARPKAGAVPDDPDA